jgi:hypothetical protein
LGYNLPVQKWGWKIQSLLLRFSVDNLFTITDYPYYNPDVNRYGGNSGLSSGWDESVYPNAKTFMLGINVKF